MRKCIRCRTKKEMPRYKRVCSACWENNAEFSREYARNWKAKNRKKIAAQRLAYRKKHLEKVRATHRKWCKKNREHLSFCRAAKAIGIPVEVLKRSHKKQKGRCACCGGKQNHRTARRLYADHSHKSKKFRAFLCQRCNTLLGLAQDHVVMLKKAIKYLRRFS